MLAKLEDLKAYLGIEGTSVDGELTRMLDVASTFVSQYLGRKCEIGSFKERRSGDDSDVLSVKNGPIVQVTKLQIDDDVIALSDGTSDGYYIEEHDIVLLGGLVFTCGRKNLIVEYIGGYNPIPADVAHSTIEIAAQAFREKEWIGFTSKSLAGETVAFQRNGFPDSAKSALDPYRRLYSCD